MSPFFSAIYEVSNLNSAEYDAVVLEAVRRFYKNWEAKLSYTWSRSFGQAEQFGQDLGNDVTVADDEAGLLGTDQRHVFKLFGRVAVARWGGVRLGGLVTYESGLPYSIVDERPVLDFPTNFIGLDHPAGFRPALTANFLQFRTLYVTGQRNDRRNAPLWTVDLQAQKEVRFDGMMLGVTLSIYNALDDRTLFISSVRQHTEFDQRREEYVTEVEPLAIRRRGRQFELMLKASF